MPLTIETGAGIVGADSYATAAELAAYAAAYGMTVPADANAQEVLLRRAASAMSAMPWRGMRTDALQPLAWPRLSIVAHGEVVDSATIPTAIKQGQMALAAEIHADDLSPATTGAVIRKKVDVLEVEYAEPRQLSRPVSQRPSLTLFAPYMTSRLNVAVVRA